jgi:class 3 adenylate cyclase
MWGLDGVALYALAIERRLHGSILPLLVGTIGVVLILFVLYVRFEQSVEILAYVCLVVAALLNQNRLLGAYGREVQDQKWAIEDLNARLEAKVERQHAEIERLDRLRGFLSPRVAELVVAGSESRLLDSHPRYIACLFCDIRPFTALSEGAEPEDTINFPQQHHGRIGELADRHNGTIGFRAGDGLMVFFNDPILCETPVLDAVRLALDGRAAVLDLRCHWERLGLDAGIGIAAGYATLGLIGASGGAGYTAIGNPVNIAARLCDIAQDCEILLDHRAHLDVENELETAPAVSRQLKGVSKPVDTYRLEGMRRDTSGRL